MRRNRIAVLVTAVAMLLAGGIGGLQTASAAPTIDGVCGSYWGTSWPPPTVSQGSVDTSNPSAVKLAQCYLNLSMSGDNLTVDGMFGPQSNTAARRFQSCAAWSHRRRVRRPQHLEQPALLGEQPELRVQSQPVT